VVEIFVIPLYRYFIGMSGLGLIVVVPYIIKTTLTAPIGFIPFVSINLDNYTTTTIPFYHELVHSSSLIAICSLYNNFV